MSITLNIQCNGSSWMYVSPSVSEGYLIDDHRQSSILSIKIPSMAGRVHRLSAGGRHNVLLTEDGEVLVWGNNAEGQLGNGTNLDSQEVS